MGKGEWSKTRDEQGWQHFLDTGVDAYSIRVEKSRGGDYTVTAFHADDAAGGDVEYRGDLTAAKKYAEEVLENGTWVELTMDPAAAMQAAA